MDRDDKILRYVQGVLTEQDRAAFEVEIAEDADLMAEVTALRHAREVMVPQTVPDVKQGWAQLSAAIDQTQLSAANENRPLFLSLMQVAAVAVASVLLWQFVVTPFFGDDAGTYTPASVGSPTPQLQVVFSDTASIGQLFELLNGLDAMIVSGPGALGIYRVSFADASARDAAMDILVARTDLVVEVIKD